MAILEYLLGHEPDTQNNAHWESLGSVPSVSQCSSPLLFSLISGAGWGMDLLCLPHRPGPWPVSAVTSQWPDPDKCPIIFTAVSTIWYESHSSGLAALLSVYRVWKIKWEAVCHPVHVAWGINRFVIEHILVYLCGEFELSATNLCDHFLWNAEPNYWR